jgi:hypothetical protein
MLETSKNVLLLLTFNPQRVLVYDLEKRCTLRIFNESERVAGSLCVLGLKDNYFPRYVLLKGHSSVTIYDTETGDFKELAKDISYGFWGLEDSIDCLLIPKRLLIATIQNSQANMKGTIRMLLSSSH